MINLIGFNRFKISPWRWLLTICICGLLLVGSSLPAFAVVTQIEEYPGQMLYQSRQSCKIRLEKRGRRSHLSASIPKEVRSSLCDSSAFPVGRR